MAGTRTVRCSHLHHELRLLKLQFGCGAHKLLLQRGSLLGERSAMRVPGHLRPSSFPRVVVH